MALGITPITATTETPKMDYTQFTKTEFERRGINSEGARLLADSLENAIASELNVTVLAAFNEIVRRLNEQGHDLTPYEIKNGDIGYRDESEEGKTQLRVGIDIVVSAGYAHLNAQRQNTDEIIEEVVENLRKAIKTSPSDDDA